MSLNFSKNSLREYLHILSQRQPVPGGGSAASYTAALGVSLLIMVSRYSQGRKNNTKVTEKTLARHILTLEKYQDELLQLTTKDSEAYLGVIKAKTGSIADQKKASKEAKQVPELICQICYKAIQIAPYLVKNGNPYLLSDVEVAVELLFAGFNGARVMVKVNS